MVRENRWGAGITEVGSRVDPAEDIPTFFDDVVNAMIKRAQEISSNQKTIKKSQILL